MDKIEKIRAEIKRLITDPTLCSTTERKIGGHTALLKLVSFIDSLQQEQQEIGLEKFTEKMDAWKARYSSPDDVPIKGTMAFTARMFYMYPDVAREWYDSLPKVTLD